ncbi:peptidoglycan editing factor PgeF [Candidatus Poribacteria bacterium]|nr:peptidoglycan editing factor PgeF [Candidatus Poribacteria bacterium]
MSARGTSLVRRAFPEEPPFDRIIAAFTTRRPNDTRAPFGSSNTGLHTGDDPISVLENRRVIFAELGLDPDSLTAAKQVHGENIARVTTSQRGMGALCYDNAIPATDALITDVPNIPLGIFTADCVPVFLYDPAKTAVGVIHAGWRSTVREITFKTVQRMTQEFGANPRDIWAAIGPSIGPCCYEVGEDVLSAFGASFQYASSLFQKTATQKWHLDLWLANFLQLRDCGLQETRIIRLGICSACNCHEYFSARKQGSRTGRTLSLIAIKQ